MGMRSLTRRQQQIVDFIENRRQSGLTSPSVREIAAEFGLRSPRTVSDHLDALRRKGVLTNEKGRGRSFRVISPLDRMRRRTVDIPVYGSVPAGFADERKQGAMGCISIDVGS